MKPRLYIETTVVSSWNFKHIANAEKAEAIRAECLQAGFVCPVICTPEELMEET